MRCAGAQNHFVPYIPFTCRLVSYVTAFSFSLHFFGYKKKNREMKNGMYNLYIRKLGACGDGAVIKRDGVVTLPPTTNHIWHEWVARPLLLFPANAWSSMDELNLRPNGALWSPHSLFKHTIQYYILTTLLIYFIFLLEKGKQIPNQMKVKTKPMHKVEEFIFPPLYILSSLRV